MQFNIILSLLGDGWLVWWKDGSVAFPNHESAQGSLTNELALQLAT